MLSTKIKICGITSPDDATLSLSLGADYLGMIFTGERRVTVDIARSIRSAVPNALLIGVFSDTAIEDVVELGRASRVNLVQLHGNESPAYCEALLSRLPVSIIKALDVKQLSDTNGLRAYTRVSYFLLDLDKNRRVNVSAPRRVNGQQEDLWSKASLLRRRGYRIFLAGALNPFNVREAVRRVEPYCIDVARGVEKSPGIKDSAALNRFFERIRG